MGKMKLFRALDPRFRNAQVSDLSSVTETLKPSGPLSNEADLSSKQGGFSSVGIDIVCSAFVLLSFSFLYSSSKTLTQRFHETGSVISVSKLCFKTVSWDTSLVLLPLVTGIIPSTWLATHLLIIWTSPSLSGAGTISIKNILSFFQNQKPKESHISI
jgi:hypothetical protein